MLPSILKTLTKKLFTRSVRPRPVTIRRARLGCEVFEDRTVPAALLWTDQADYAPGSTATISGSGFAVGETIHLEVTLADGTVQGTPDNPWDVVDGGAGDLDGVADGNITTTWYVEPTYASNQSLIASAMGLTSGETATAEFTDTSAIQSVKLNGTALTGSNSITVATGSNITVTIAVKNTSGDKWRATGYQIYTGSLVTVHEVEACAGMREGAAVPDLAA